MGFQDYFSKLVPLQQQAQVPSVQQQAGMPPQAQLDQARMLRTGSMQDRMAALETMKKTGITGGNMPSYGGNRLMSGIQGLMGGMGRTPAYPSYARPVPTTGIASLPRQAAYSSTPNQAMTNIGRVVK